MHTVGRPTAQTPGGTVPNSSHLSQPDHAPDRSGPTQRKRLLPLLIAAACCLPPAVLAGDIEVTVLEKTTGRALRGASVCLGTPADPIQLGGELSAGNGSVLFRDVPSAPLLLIVSKNGFVTQRLPISGAPGDSGKVILLGKGPQGPLSCRLPAFQPTTDQPGTDLGTPSLAINGGARSTHQRRVRLDIATPSDANQFRASESADLSGAQWLPLNGSPSFQLSPGPGLKRVYIQLRRYREIRGATLETRSGTARDDIRLE